MGNAARTWSTPEKPSNPVGYATASWPKSEFEHALSTIFGLGFKGVQILGWVREAYGGSRIEIFRERLKTLKLQPVTLSCSDVNLDPDRPKDEKGQVCTYAAFLRKLGGLCLQVTDGGDPRRTFTAQAIRTLGERMNVLGKLA